MKLLMDVSFQLSIRDEDWMLGTDTYTAYFRPAVVFARSMILALIPRAIFRCSCQVGTVFAAHTWLPDPCCRSIPSGIARPPVDARRPCAPCRRARKPTFFENLSCIA